MGGKERFENAKTDFLAFLKATRLKMCLRIEFSCAEGVPFVKLIEIRLFLLKKSFFDYSDEKKLHTHEYCSFSDFLSKFSKDFNLTWILVETFFQEYGVHFWNVAQMMIKFFSAFLGA